MKGVTLRCPTCGTTQNHQGECDACSEDAVRYFCDNHGEGRWLEGPVCSVCGAEFGKDEPRARPAPAPAPPRIPPFTGPRTRSRVPPRRPGTPPRMEPRPDTVDEGDRGEPERMPTYADVITDMLEERERASHRVERRLPDLPPAAVAPSYLMGCLGRLAFLVILLIAIVVFGLFLLVGGAFGAAL